MSEWIAYYQMHGFDHVILYNDSSVDNSGAEIEPWLRSGFVSVVSHWSHESLNIGPAFVKSAFKESMTIKGLLEGECKKQALKWGYDYFFSLDIDEYVMPVHPDITIVDALDDFFNDTDRKMYCMDKLNFQVTPHSLEPVNLLTIEAYQHRMRQPSKMSYYTSVAPKCAFRLRHPEYNANHTEYVTHCCHFHGCQGIDYRAGTTFCRDHEKEEGWDIKSKGKKWKDSLYINHYSRSLEKYVIKGKTWKTASGEVTGGMNSHQAARSYDIPKFLSRNLGWYFDNRGVRFGCELRELLRNVTGEPVYLRPGGGWYRNAEFGKEVTDPEKRGRYGRVNAPGFKFSDGNPYHYHGGYTMEELLRIYPTQAPVMTEGAANGNQTDATGVAIPVTK